MSRFIAGGAADAERVVSGAAYDWIAEDNPVRAVDAFVDELDLAELGIDGVQPAATGRPPYHPATLLKIYIYGYLNRIQSSRRLEREAQRNVELIWLTGRLMPDFFAVMDRPVALPGQRQRRISDRPAATLSFGPVSLRNPWRSRADPANFER